jgi:adenylate cyclase
MVTASPRRGVSFRLRPTLLTVVLGLLVATVGSIGAIAFVKTADSIESLAAQQFTAVTQATVERVQTLVATTPRILREYEAQAQRGILPLNDFEALGLRMAERLRQNPDLAWIGYADAQTGAFIGATRRDAESVRIYTARPDINGGVPVEEEVAASGERRIVASPETAPYKVTEKDWFRTSMTLVGLSWLDAYTFTDGRRGVTAVLPLRLAGDTRPRGILHVDVFIDTLVHRLDRLAVGKSGRVHLLDGGGTRVASPTAWRNGDPMLADALAAFGGPEALKRLAAGAGREAVYDEGGEEWRASFVHVAIPGGPDWIVAVVAPESEFTGVARRNAWWTLAAGLGALLLAAWAAFVVSRRIAEPLRLISLDLERLAVFSFDGPPAPTSFVREVEVVGRTVARMKASLRSFGHYVPTELVRDLLASGREAELGGERRNMTIQFSDIAGFTSISEKLSPERLVEELGDYFSLMREALREHEGTLDKYMGDGIMAFFNAPKLSPMHETKACLAALDAQSRLAIDRERRRREKRPEFSARIGLAVGEVIVGNIGTPDRFAYTVIGDSVNLASRLEGVCKFYGVAITASGEVRAATGDAFEWRHLDRVAVVGRSGGTDIYELLCRRGELPPTAATARDSYETALQDYFAGQFGKAAARFREIAGSEPSNLAADMMARRARKLHRMPPEGIWTGVYVHTKK